MGLAGITLVKDWPKMVSVCIDNSVIVAVKDLDYCVAASLTQDHPSYMFCF